MSVRTWSQVQAGNESVGGGLLSVAVPLTYSGGGPSGGAPESRLSSHLLPVPTFALLPPRRCILKDSVLFDSFGSFEISFSAEVGVKKPQRIPDYLGAFSQMLA